jgi:capsular polysaccharide biosynthesis protein
LDLLSPAFSIAQPMLRHADLIPDASMRAMRATWCSGTFQERGIGVFLIENAYVAEEGLVFDEHGRLFEETRTQHSQDQIERGRAATLEAVQCFTPPLPGTFVLCKKPGARNYGHWLAEMLPRACVLCADKQLSERFGYIIQDNQGQLGRVIDESLGLLRIEHGALVRTDDRPLCFEQLLIVHELTNHGTFMSPLVVNCLETLTRSIKGFGHEKLYVQRHGVPSRRFANEDEIEARALANGFTLFDPAGLSFIEQVAAFKDARHVVGVMGAALSNVVFAPRGATVVTLAPASMPDTFFWFLAGLKGHAYLEVRCRQVGPIRGVTAWDTDLVLEPGDLDMIFGDLPT